jgi:hypothetical protein
MHQRTKDATASIPAVGHFGRAECFRAAGVLNRGVESRKHTKK